MRLRKLVSLATALMLTFGFVGVARAATPGLTPTFGTPVPIAGGFAVEITNWDANYTWTTFSSDCSTATISDGLLTVTGVLAEQSVTTRVFTNRTGYDEGTAKIVGTAADFNSRVTLHSGISNATDLKTTRDSDGNLFAVFTSDSNSNMHLVRSSDAGGSWETLQTWVIAQATSRVHPAVAVSSSGAIAITWQTGANGSSTIFASVSTDGGSTWSSPSSLNATANTQLLAAAFDTDGDLIVAWNEIDNGFHFSYRVSDDLGTTWSTESRVPAAGSSVYYPELVAAETGAVYAAWATGSSVHSSIFDAASNVFAASASIAATASVSYEVGYAADPAGNLFASWTEGSAPNETVYLSSFDGTVWATASQVSSTAGTFKEPRIAASAQKVVVAWVVDGGNQALVRSGSNTASITWDSSEQTVSGSANSVWRARLTRYDSSKFALAWLQKANAGENYFPVLTYSSDGNSWTAPQQTTTHPENNYEAQPVADSDGRLGLLWKIQGATSLYHSVALASTAAADPREIYQVAEINPGASHANVYAMEILNNKMYLVTRSDTTGYELFEYANGQISLVDDLYEGTGSGVYDTGIIANTGTELYLQATDGTTGYELYKFDGTQISLVADINPANADPTSTSSQLTNGSKPGYGALLGTKLFFVASYPSSSTGYVIDLSQPSPAPVRMLDYFSSPAFSTVYDLTVVGSNLYFRSSGGLYQTDGTASPALIPGTAGLRYFGLAGFNGKLVISASPTGNDANVELMVWDPADPTTAASLVENINTYNTGGEKGSYPTSFAVRCNELYFTASSGFGGVIDNRELWKWDGYEVSLAKDFFPGSLATDTGRPAPNYVSGEEMFTFAQASGTGFEPWIIQGSEATMLADFRAGSDSGVSGSPPILTWNDQTYMALWGPTGVELYAYGAKPAGFQAAAYSPTYTISYDANGGTGTTTSSHAGGSVTLSSGTGFAMSGKVLLGWDTSSAATTATYAPSASYTLSGNVTLYAVWGDPSSTPTINPNLPTLDLPTGGGIPTAPSGGDLELTGKNLGGVKEAEVDTKKATIKEQGPTNLTLGLPELDPGIYDLSLTGDQGKLTIQGAVRVISGFASVTPDAQALIAAWTKVNEDRTEVRMYAKDPVGVGKVQFKVNGREIAWVRAVDETDPKLWSQGGSEYLLRRVQLAPGKNRFEIWLNGVRIIRSTYKG